MGTLILLKLGVYINAGQLITVKRYSFTWIAFGKTGFRGVKLPWLRVLNKKKRIEQKKSN